MTIFSNAPRDPRLERLDNERQSLEELSRNNDHVKVEFVPPRHGGAPEKYKVTFLCRGIVGIDASQNPIYGQSHEVEMYCHDDFPSAPPLLRWNTPIWHPNIQHAEPKNVCINKPAWLGANGLVNLCHLMFDMVQYKNYHALNVWPYPLDPDAARWVLEVAEPRGIVDKARSISVDDKPFYQASPAGQIKFKTALGNVDNNLTERVKILGTAGRKGVEADRQAVLQAAAKPLRIKIRGAGGES